MGMGLALDHLWRDVASARSPDPGRGNVTGRALRSRTVRNATEARGDLREDTPRYQPKEADMLTTATAIFSRATVARTKRAARFFTDEFLAVALFSAIGLLVALVVVFSGVQAVWL